MRACTGCRSLPFAPFRRSQDAFGQVQGLSCSEYPQYRRFSLTYFGKLQSRQKTLPQELIQQIVLAVDPSLLTTLARTCHSLQVEAERLLYQCILIDELFVLRSVHDALIASPRIRGTAVRSLIIPMRKRPFPSENIDYAQHIRGILSLTPKLTCFKTYHYPTYRTRILRPTPGLKLGFKLKTLVVRFSFDPSLLDFLTSQTEIEDLEIIGWKGDDASSSLPSTALPKLRTLTGTHESVRKLAPGRPITTVSVDRFWHDHDDFKNALSGLLDALGHSTASGVANLRLHLPEIHTGRDVKKIGDMLPSLRRLTLHADWIPLDAFIVSPISLVLGSPSH